MQFRIRMQNIRNEITALIADKGIESLLLPQYTGILEEAIEELKKSGGHELAELLENFRFDFESVKSHAEPLLLAGEKEKLFGFYSFISQYEKDWWLLTAKYKS